MLLSQFPIVLLSQILHMSAELSIRKTGDTEHFRSVPHPFIDIAYRQISFEETDTYIHILLIIVLEQVNLLYSGSVVNCQIFFPQPAIKSVGAWSDFSFATGH